MDVALRKIGSVTIIDLNGRLTVETNTASLHDILGVLLSFDLKQVVFNMEHVPFMDCSGIGQIITCYRRTYDEGGMLKLLKLGRRIKHLFKISRLLTIIETFDDERVAVTSFCESSQSNVLSLKQSLEAAQQGLKTRATPSP